MKNTILVLAMIAVCSIFKIQAQDKPINCDAEKWAYQPNLIIESQTYEIGVFHVTTLKNEYKKVFIDVNKYKDITSGITKSCARISNYMMNFKTDDVEWFPVSIDIDEVDGIINFIKKIQSDVINTKPENKNTLTYRSRNGFRLEFSYSSCISIDEKTGHYKFAQEKCWNGLLFFPNEGAESKRLSFVYFKQTEISELLNLFEQAKEKM